MHFPNPHRPPKESGGEHKLYLLNVWLIPCHLTKRSEERVTCAAHTPGHGAQVCKDSRVRNLTIKTVSRQCLALRTCMARK